MYKRYRKILYFFIGVSLLILSLIFHLDRNPSLDRSSFFNIFSLENIIYTVSGFLIAGILYLLIGKIKKGQF